jgi:dipeptidase E
VGKKIDRKDAKLVFITTAAEVEEGDLKWKDDDRQSLVDAGFQVTDYTITGQNREEIKNFLKDFDIIYFSGGNTFYLLEKIQQSNCRDVITDFVKNGKIYIGSSAGSVIAGPNIEPLRDLDNYKKAPNLEDFSGLGLVDFVVFPHWGHELFRDRYLNHRIHHTYNEENKIILLTNNQFIQVKDDWYRIIEVDK